MVSLSPEWQWTFRNKLGIRIPDSAVINPNQLKSRRRDKQKGTCWKWKRALVVKAVALLDAEYQPRTEWQLVLIEFSAFPVVSPGRL